MRRFASGAHGLSTHDGHRHRMITHQHRGMMMRAAVTTGSAIEVRDDVPDPTPGPGQVLVHTIVCGICGSALHALAEPEVMVLQEAMLVPVPRGWMRAQPRSPSRSRLAIIRSPSPIGGPAGRVMSWA